MFNKGNGWIFGQTTGASLHSGSHYLVSAPGRRRQIIPSASQKDNIDNPSINKGRREDEMNLDFTHVSARRVYFTAHNVTWK